MKATAQTDHTHDFRLTGAALALALSLGGARAENRVVNGDFSWQPNGTAATMSGAGAQVACLYTSKPPSALTDHVVSASVFVWFGEALTLPITVVPANPGTRIGSL